MNEAASQLLRALENTTSAYAAIEAVSGGLDPFGDSNLTEVRLELQHLCRRLSNMCLLHGVSPVAVEKIRDGIMRIGTTRADPRGRCGNALVPTHRAG